MTFVAVNSHIFDTPTSYAKKRYAMGLKGKSRVWTDFISLMAVSVLAFEVWVSGCVRGWVWVSVGVGVGRLWQNSVVEKDDDFSWVSDSFE